MVCKDIRGDARKIFYAESKFDVHVQDFNVQAVLPWLQIYSRFTDERTTMAEVTSTKSEVEDEFDVSGVKQETEGVEVATSQSSTVFEDFPVPMNEDGPTTYQMRQWMQCRGDSVEQSSIEGKLYWTLHPSASWSNLIDWLERFHSGSMHRYSLGAETAAQYQMINNIFDHIQSHNGLEWTHLEKGLPSWRKALATAVDARWMEDSDDRYDSYSEPELISDTESDSEEI